MKSNRQLSICIALLVTFLSEVSLRVASADTALFYSMPAERTRYVSRALRSEYGTTDSPPILETTSPYYLVSSCGSNTVNFRFRNDTGAFNFSFGYYLISPKLTTIDLSSDAGKEAYANAALAPGNATLVFDNLTDRRGATRSFRIASGTVLGFFLIPDARLQQFQTQRETFALTGVGSDSLRVPGARRWPLFSFADANPGGLDQLLSFIGTNSVSLFAWEDLTRTAVRGNPFPSDNQFNDLIFSIDGIEPDDHP